MPKNFSQYAVDKINAILKDHSNHIGSQLKKSNPAKYKDFISSDCITMAIWVLKDAFNNTGNPSVAKRVGGLGEKGTELAKFLIDSRMWKAIYYNPDVNHPMDGKSEHIVSYYNQVKKTCTYSSSRVPISRTVINYNPSDQKVTPYLDLTKKNDVSYNALKKIPFGLGMSRGGTHVWLYSYGKVYESHWDKEPDTGLYTAVELNAFPWLSGIIVIPPDSHHLLPLSKVECK